MAFHSWRLQSKLALGLPHRRRERRWLDRVLAELVRGGAREAAWAAAKARPLSIRRPGRAASVPRRPRVHWQGRAPAVRSTDPTCRVPSTRARGAQGYFAGRGRQTGRPRNGVGKWRRTRACRTSIRVPVAGWKVYHRSHPDRKDVGESGKTTLDARRFARLQHISIAGPATMRAACGLPLYSLPFWQSPPHKRTFPFRSPARWTIWNTSG